MDETKGIYTTICFVRGEDDPIYQRPQAQTSVTNCNLVPIMFQNLPFLHNITQPLLQPGGPIVKAIDPTLQGDGVWRPVARC